MLNYETPKKCFLENIAQRNKPKSSLNQKDFQPNAELELKRNHKKTLCGSFQLADVDGITSGKD